MDYISNSLVMKVNQFAIVYSGKGIYANLVESSSPLYFKKKREWYFDCMVHLFARQFYSSKGCHVWVEFSCFVLIILVQKLCYDQELNFYEGLQCRTCLEVIWSLYWSLCKNYQGNKSEHMTNIWTKWKFFLATLINHCPHDCHAGSRHTYK